MENQMGKDTTQWKPVSKERCLDEIGVNYCICHKIYPYSKI